MLFTLGSENSLERQRCHQGCSGCRMRTIRFQLGHLSHQLLVLLLQLGVVRRCNNWRNACSFLHSRQWPSQWTCLGSCHRLRREGRLQRSVLVVFRGLLLIRGIHCQNRNSLSIMEVGDMEFSLVSVPRNPEIYSHLRGFDVRRYHHGCLWQLGLNLLRGHVGRCSFFRWCLLNRSRSRRLQRRGSHRWRRSSGGAGSMAARRSCHRGSCWVLRNQRT